VLLEVFTILSATHEGEKMNELDAADNRGYDWRKRSREIKQRDEDTCQRCGKQKYEDGRYNTGIVTHHIVPGRELPKCDARCDLNLVTVCTNCHEAIEGKPAKTQFLQCERPSAGIALDMLSEGRCTAEYIADSLDVPTIYIKKRLAELKRLGLVHDVYRGLYELEESVEG